MGDRGDAHQRIAEQMAANDGSDKVTDDHLAEARRLLDEHDGSLRSALRSLTRNRSRQRRRGWRKEH